MDLIDVKKDSVTLMKYIGPFSPKITASDSKTLTNIFITKGSSNLEINPGLNPLVGSTNTISDVKLSQQKLISGDENKDNKSSENVGIVIKSEVIYNDKKSQRVLADKGSVGIHVDGKKTLTNLYTSKIRTDANTSDLLKANLSSTSINKAVKQCTNLSGGLVDGNFANKSLHSLTTGESSLLSSRTIGMSGIKMAPTPHLDHTSNKSGIKSSIASGLTSIHCSTASGLRDVHQNLRSGFGGAHVGIKKGDSNSLASIMVSSMDPRKGLALLDNKMKIAPGGCVLDVTGLDAGSKLDHGKVRVNPKSLNKGDIRVPVPAIFADCQFALELSINMSLSEKTNLRKTITSHGGTVSFIVTKKSTHVICSDPEKADASYKCKMANKYGIPIICVDYVRDCADKGRLLNTDNYLLSGKTKAEELRLGKISASRQQKQETKQKAKPHFNTKNVKVWKFGEKDCPVFDEENYQIAKYAMFKKLDKSTETTAFCVLELHVVDLKVDGTSEHRFRVFCHHGILHNVEEGQAGDIEIRFAQTSEEVVAIYAHLYHEQMKPPHSMTLTFDLLSRHVGSQKFKQMMEEIGVECGVISPAVSGLVNYVWEEAVGNLQQNLRGPLTSIKTEQIDKAEGILKQMREAVEKDNTLRLLKLKEEFYKEIPYQQAVSASDVNKTWISRTFDLCQLIRDLIAVSEATDWSARPSDEAKYRALRCNIEHLESTSPEFKTIKDYLLQSLEGGMSLKVERIFHVHRLAEDSNFRMDLEPRKLLFHSSRVENFMGIFSRGLLMPRVVVDDHGGKRTDPGMLGSGIYFAEAGSTSAGYSTPGKTKGTRLMLINEVALGSCFGTTKHNKSLTEPPEGYQSVHGIKATESCLSDFKADEYVVYNTNQQKMKYLVEFTRPGDKITAQAVGSVLPSQQLFIDGMDTDDDDDLAAKEVDLKDVANVIDPVLKVKAGLVSSGDALVDLKQVHISARLLDMVSQVVVIQEYYNNSSAPLEAKYVFPLDEMAAVCGFEAFINGKHIIGEVKEKETAHKEYKKAISEGHGAYLMDQDEETPDVFTISVGNLPPGATVFIKITYVAELQVEEELISFRLPGSVAPWSKDAALQDKTQSDLATVEVKQGTTSLLVAVEMPFDIRTIECPTHKVKLKKTLTKAVVELCSGQNLSDGFQLLIGLAEIHVPRMWVERKDIDSYRQACMLSFYPEFEASDNEESDVIFLLDLSNSMKGAALTQAKKVLLLTLNHIPKQWTFNVIVFGTAYREIFPGGVCKTPENVKKVEKFVQGLKADMGNTEALRPIHSLHLLKQESSLRNVFLITDGHVNNEEATLAEIHCHCQNTRIFTFGISSTANRHLLRALARMGGGAFEFFDPKSKSKWESKVKSQISKAGHIGLTSISVHWEQYDSDVAAPVQAPQNINAIFSGSRQVIYGFVPNCTMATLKAEIDGHEVSTVVSTSDLSITEGKILHSLTARAIIRDWEDGLLSLDRADQEILKSKTKNMIIELSKEYSIVTQFTSFVAIEKRDEDKEVDENELLVMNDLIEREARDILQSMGYSSSSSTTSSSTSSSCTDKEVDENELLAMNHLIEREAMEIPKKLSSSSSYIFGLETDSPYSYSSRKETDLVTEKVLCNNDEEDLDEDEDELDGYENQAIRMMQVRTLGVDKEMFEIRAERMNTKSVSEGPFSEEDRKMPSPVPIQSVFYSSETSPECTAVNCAEEEDSYEDMGFGLFGDDDGITLKAQSPVMLSEKLYIEEDRKMPSPVPKRAVFYSSETSPEHKLEAQMEEERMRQEVEERQRRIEEEWRGMQEEEVRKKQEEEQRKKCEKKAFQPEAQREEERMWQEVEDGQRRDEDKRRRGQEEEQRRREQEEEFKAHWEEERMTKGEERPRRMGMEERTRGMEEEIRRRDEEEWRSEQEKVKRQQMEEEERRKDEEWRKQTQKAIRQKSRNSIPILCWSSSDTTYSDITLESKMPEVAVDHTRSYSDSVIEQEMKKAIPVPEEGLQTGILTRRRMSRKKHTYDMIEDEPEELHLSPPQLPTIQPPPPLFAGRDSMASPPAPKYYDKPMTRAMTAPSRQERRQRPSLLSADLEEFYPLPSQSSLNISAVQRAPPPPAPPLAVNISPPPIPKWRQRPLPDVMHLETEELMPPQSMKTLSTVSWRAFSVPTDRMKNSIEGDFERIRSRFLAGMKHEPVVVEESSLIEGGTLGQVVTTDLGRYGIGVNVECIAVRPIRGPPANIVDCIMKLQKEDGHWEFDADLEEILGVDKNLCLHLLYTAGLKSMGESAVQAIIQLAATLIVLLSIYKKLFPSSHLTNLRQVDQQNNMYNKIRTAVSKLGFGQQFDNAIAYCNRMKKQHSLVPATLELGKSWEEMVGKMLDIHAEN